MSLDLSLPDQIDELKPNITVIGVGGAGGNAVNNMIRSQLTGVEFMAANTDSQALRLNQADHKIQLGLNISHGLGAGSRPDIGRAAAEEALDEIMAHLEGTHMVFITAGMGGGTGTGAAPVIARAAREHGILTVGVVTKPFHFEGRHRMTTADAGIEELATYVDTLIVIPNQNLFRIATDKTTFADAFNLADDVLHSGVRGVTDLMVKPGLINLDFADIRAVMREMGKAMMGTGEATGERRAVDAAEAAISNPLLDDASMKGARGVLINITGGADMTLFEVDEAANRIRDEVDPEANIIFGATFDDSVEGTIRVSVVATGIDSQAAAVPKPQQERPAADAVAAAPAAAAAVAPVAAAAEAGEAAVAASAEAEAPLDLTVAAEAVAPAAVAEAAPAEVAPVAQAPAPVAPAAPQAEAEAPAPRTSRWSLFGSKSKAAKAAPPQPFVAPAPARPTEEEARVAAPAMTAPPAAQPAVAGESAEDKQAGFANLFTRNVEVEAQTTAPTPAPQPASVHPFPAQASANDGASDSAAPEANPEAKSEDVLEIPAFLRRQAR